MPKQNALYHQRRMLLASGLSFLWSAAKESWMDWFSNYLHSVLGYKSRVRKIFCKNRSSVVSWHKADVRGRPLISTFWYYTAISSLSNVFQDSCNRSGYIISNSPCTFPQFRIGIAHFLVASNMDRYSAFKRACGLGKTLLWRFSFRNEAFKLSIAFVV